MAVSCEAESLVTGGADTGVIVVVVVVRLTLVSVTSLDLLASPLTLSRDSITLSANVSRVSTAVRGFMCTAALAGLLTSGMDTAGSSVDTSGDCSEGDDIDDLGGDAAVSAVSADIVTTDNDVVVVIS